MKIQEYYDPTVCARCNGECCKRMPAPYHPKDIVRIFGSVEKAVQSDIVAIDWWEGETPLYFMRPKTKKTDSLYDPSWGGECIHFVDGKGCSLPREEMPWYCKILEPMIVCGETKCDDYLKDKAGKPCNGNFHSALAFKAAKIKLGGF